MRTYPHPRSVEYITGLAAMRGGQWGLQYAEAFEVVLRAYQKHKCGNVQSMMQKVYNVIQ